MPRRARQLTDSDIKNAKPLKHAYKRSDGQGLYIKIMPTGSKLWRMKIRFQGREDTLSFGPYPAVSLADARKERDKARHLLAQGIHPREHEKALDTAAKSQELTFEKVAWEWHRHMTSRWAPSTAYKAKLYLKNDILPVVGNQPIALITRPDLVELVSRVEARGILNAAGKIRQWLAQIFSYGLARGMVGHSPATDLNVISAATPAPKHHPYIPLQELPELLRRLEIANIHVLTRTAIRLLILTGARPGELRAAPWSEFDLDAATWTIPLERMKARRSHVIPLPRQAVALLRSIAEITNGYLLVFAGQNDPERPMSENTINKALRLMGYKGRQTGHGFRHLLSTELNNREYNRDWIERQLAHGDKDEIRGTYNHALYLDQRRKMMQEWADSLDTLCAGDTITPIRSRKRA